jgi:hypothetical protein
MLQAVIPALSENSLDFKLTPLIISTPKSTVVRCGNFLHGDSRSTTQLGLTWFTSIELSEDQTIPLWPFLILNDVPQLLFGQSSTVIRTRVKTVQDIEAVVSISIFTVPELPQSNSHNLVAGVTVGYSHHLSQAAK